MSNITNVHKLKKYFGAVFEVLALLLFLITLLYMQHHPSEAYCQNITHAILLYILPTSVQTAQPRYAKVQ